MSISRRNLLATSGGLAALVLTGCGNPSDAQRPGTSGQPAGTAPAGGTVNLIMSNHPWQRGIEPLLPKFTQQTGVQVNVQTFAEQQMRDKILLNLQSRSDAMDVFMSLPSREGVQFSKLGYYEPLDQYMTQAGAGFDASDFSKGSMEAMVALHNRGCSRGLNPPASSSDRAM